MESTVTNEMLDAALATSDPNEYFSQRADGGGFEVGYRTPEGDEVIVQTYSDEEEGIVADAVDMLQRREGLRLQIAAAIAVGETA